MSTPPTDRLVANAHIGPHDTPHEAATHVWAQVVVSHDVDPGGPLAQLGVFDRVVLVLRDVIGLSDATAAQVLNTNEAAVRRAHGTARSRIGLPPPGGDQCEAWADVRAAHLPGDPAVLAGLVAHTHTCPHCSGATLTDQQRRPPWRARRAVGVAAAGTVTASSVPALVGAIGAAAAVVTAAVMVAASVAPLPEPARPHAVVVDADPDLPSDEEPVEGWPPPPVGGERGAASTAGDGGSGSTETPSEPVDDTTGTVDDPTDPVTDPLDDLVDDVTDTVKDVTDGIDKTLDGIDETLDETLDAIDETAEGAEDVTGLP